MGVGLAETKQVVGINHLGALDAFLGELPCQPLVELDRLIDTDLAKADAIADGPQLADLPHCTVRNGRRDDEATGCWPVGSENHG